MMEIRHKGGRFTIDEKEIMYLSFEDLQAMQETKMPLKNKYCVSGVTKSGCDCVLFKSNDEYMARNVYDLIKAKIEPGVANPFVLPTTCDDHVLGLVYD